MSSPLSRQVLTSLGWSAVKRERSEFHLILSFKLEINPSIPKKEREGEQGEERERMETGGKMKG